MNYATLRKNKFFRKNGVAALSAVLCAGLFSQSALANINAWQIPASYFSHTGITHQNVNGVTIDFRQSGNSVLTVPAMRSERVSCDTITGAGAANQTMRNKLNGRRANCWTKPKNQRPRCQDIYQGAPGTIPKAAINAASRALSPMKRATEYVADVPSTHFAVAVNAGFFDLTAFNGRSNNQSQFKTLFQEACALNLGDYKPTWDGQRITRWDAVQRNPDGSGQVPFGTMVFNRHSNAISFWRKGTNFYAPHSTSTVPGVYLRWNGALTHRSNTQYVPKVVRDKWNSKVGRTAIGVDKETQDVRIVVIQPGINNVDQPGKGKGINLWELTDFFPPKYEHVMLLDGGGSSQYATNFPIGKPANARPTRRNCPDGVRECSFQGNVVGRHFVSHWDNNVKRSVPGNNNVVAIDRRVPNAILITQRK